MSAYRIPISRPNVGDEEVAAMAACVRSGRLTEGPQVEAFEAAFAAMCGAAHAVAVSNGTAALALALAAHGIGPGDEVIVPSFTFTATAGAVRTVGAEAVFADIDPITWCLDAGAAEHAVGPRTAAILPVHLYGHPADLVELRAVSRRHDLLLVEDAAQAHGATVGSQVVGGSGTACFSFHATKNITTAGEGGMVCTDDPAVAESVRAARSHGPGRLSGNHRLSEPAAACGLVQLRGFAAASARRQAIADRYASSLEAVDAPQVVGDVSHAWHKYTVAVGNDRRDDLVSHLQRRGIEARVYYRTPVHEQPAYASCRRADELKATADAARGVASLPLFAGLTDVEVDDVLHAVAQWR